MSRYPLYENMEFPKYQFQEYPKWVKGPNGDDVMVKDQKEELAAIAERPKSEDPRDLENEKLAKALDQAKRDQQEAREALEKQAALQRTKDEELEALRKQVEELNIAKLEAQNAPKDGTTPSGVGATTETQKADAAKADTGARADGPASGAAKGLAGLHKK